MGKQTIFINDVSPLRDHNIALEIDLYIHKTDQAECLTSNYKYIRECKKWMLDNNYGAKVQLALVHSKLLRAEEKRVERHAFNTQARKNIDTDMTRHINKNYKKR